MITRGVRGQAGWTEETQRPVGESSSQGRRWPPSPREDTQTQEQLVCLQTQEDAGGSVHERERKQAQTDDNSGHGPDGPHGADPSGAGRRVN